VGRNPIILLGVSLPFVIATATSLRNAAAMSLEYVVINFVTAVLSVLIAGKAPFWVRAAINVGAATVVMMLTRALITWMMPDISNYLGTYIYLMALNGMVLLQSEEAVRPGPVKLWPVMKGVVINVAVFAVMMLIVSLPREYLGNGTLWGRAIPAPVKLSGVQLPFFGFISVGFLLAFVRFTTKKIQAFGIVDGARKAANERARYTAIHVEIDE
jgi:Na+-transporting NADH:ubiquinone oxidoreductase subunit NqrD